MSFTVWITVWMALKSMKTKGLAERVGFEPTIPVKVYTLSKRAPSATPPSLRVKGILIIADAGFCLSVSDRLRRFSLVDFAGPADAVTITRHNGIELAERPGQRWNGHDHAGKKRHGHS